MFVNDSTQSPLNMSGGPGRSRTLPCAVLVLALLGSAFLIGVTFGAAGWFPAGAIRDAAAAVRGFDGFASSGADSSDFMSLSVSERDDLATAFSEGGLIIHFRHAQRTHADDVHGFDAMEASSAESDAVRQFTCLNAEGIAQAQLTGWVFDVLHIQVERVLSSPSCRAIQHAEIAGLGRITIAPELHYASRPFSEEYVFAQSQNEFVARLADYSGNTILFGHDPRAFLNSDLVLRRGDQSREQGGLTIFRATDDGRLQEIITFSTLTEFLKMFW